MKTINYTSAKVLISIDSKLNRPVQEKILILDKTQPYLLYAVLQHLFNIFRSSHQDCSKINIVLRNFGKFTGKLLCQSTRPATLSKKRLWHRCFPANFAKFLRAPFSKNTSGRLLLSMELVIVCKIVEPDIYKTLIKR